MKGYFGLFYVVVAVLTGLSLHFFSNDAYHGMAFNLGQGFAWPILLLKRLF